MAALVMLGALPASGWAQAQTRPNLGVGYSFLREIGSNPATYKSGWVVDLASEPKSSISLVGEVGANYRAPASVRQTLSSYQGGIRLTPSKEGITGFFQLLAGIERFSEPGFSERGFALQPGTGMDFPMTSYASVRAQIDYRFVRVGATPSLSAVSFKEFRVVVGVAVGLGK